MGGQTALRLATHCIYNVRKNTVKLVLSGHSKRRQKLFFKTNYPREHSAILSTCIKLPFVFKTFVLSHDFEWPLKTGFTVSAS